MKNLRSAKIRKNKREYIGRSQLFFYSFESLIFILTVLENVYQKNKKL